MCAATLITPTVTFASIMPSILSTQYHFPIISLFTCKFLPTWYPMKVTKAMKSGLKVQKCLGFDYLCLVKRGNFCHFCQSFRHFLRKSTWQTKSAWEPSCQDPTLPETWMKCCRELLCYGKYWKELLSLLLCKVLVSAAHCFNENWEDNSWCSNMISL